MIPDKERRVIIVGGGFAGATAARFLERRLSADWDIFLLTQRNVLTYNPLLPEVVGGELLPGHVSAPIRQMLSRTRIRMVSVTSLDPPTRTVHYSGVRDGTLSGDHLVLATGMAANVTIVPGMAEHSVPMKTLGDALHLRNLVLRRLEEATLTRDVDRRRWLMTFVVIGGGFSGVEIAGQIFDLVWASCRYYRNVRREELRVILIHSGERLLPEISPELGRCAGRMLVRRGIEVRLGARVRCVEEGVARIGQDDGVAGATIVSTIGVAPHAFIRDSTLPLEGGRIVTEPDLRVVGFDAVWAVGDCARIVNAHNGHVSPPSAQFAVRQARLLGRNLLADVAGASTSAFQYRPVGHLAAIGHHRAVAEVFCFRVHGLPAWLMWRGLYLLKIPTLAAKVRLFFEWTWAMFFPRDLGCLEFERTTIELTTGGVNETRGRPGEVGCRTVSGSG